jgi:hypothetical protein
MSPAASSGRNESLVTSELCQTLRRYYAARTAQRAIPTSLNTCGAAALPSLLRHPEPNPLKEYFGTPQLLGFQDQNPP